MGLCLIVLAGCGGGRSDLGQIEGAVRFISDTIEHRPVYAGSAAGPEEQFGLYQRLMCRNDGEPLRGDF